MNKNMRAIILAGGYGTRLRPLTCGMPKPMVPVANKPMLGHLLALLRHHNFTDLVTMLHYHPKYITDYIKDGQSFGMSVKTFAPEVDYGTAGCVRWALDSEGGGMFSGKSFVVVSGDVLTDFDLTEALRFHEERKAIATIILTRVADPLSYGIVVTGEDGRIQRFLEKPSWGEVFSDTINTGIYILRPEALKHVVPDKPFDFSKDLFPALLSEGAPIYGCIVRGYWKDIGNLTEYRLAHYDILDGKINLDLPGQIHDASGHCVRMGKDAYLAGGARVGGPLIMGENTRISAGALVTNSVLGNDVTIEEGATVEGSVVWDGSVICQGAYVKEAVVGRSARIGSRSTLHIGAVIGDECEVGTGATVRSGIKMWPHKVLEDGAVLSTSLVWGDRFGKSLFGAYGISGLTNIELTAEFAARVGAAYGAFLGKGAYVITSRDAHKASRMLKRSLISGLLSAGVRVGDLRTAPMPVMRYELGNEGESGGVHVRQSPFNPRLMDIKFFENDGSDLAVSKEKAIEQLFLREDFKRASVDEVGDITIPPRAQEYYLAGFLKAIDSDAIRNAKFKIILDYAHSSASMIFPVLLGELGIEVVALNAELSARKLTKTEREFRASLEQLAHIVTTVNANAGFLFDAGAEKLFLVDEKGNILPNDIALMSVVYMVSKSAGSLPKNKFIGVPVNATRLIEEITAKSHMTVLRTPISPRQIMAVAKKEGAGFVGDGIGGFVFPEFQPFYDAMYATVKTLELIAKTGMSFGQVTQSLGPRPHVVHMRVACPWDKKGQVMRLAAASVDGKNAALIDGVKLFLKTGWVLVQPDADEAYVHIWSEANAPDYAKSQAEKYAEKVKFWQESKQL